MKEIKFYKVNDSYGFFSNFSPYPIYVDGEVWATVEHYFQASKFKDIAIKEKIKSFDSPMKVALEGRHMKNDIRNDWDSVKENVMSESLQAKFLQHPKLRIELLNSGNAIIIEHTSNDSYWGDGGDGTGQNRLGSLLMETREKIKIYSDDLLLVLPPWIAFPAISQYDLFWRMGLGEEYLTQWSKYYFSTDKNIYRKKFPEVKEWEGIYD